MLHASKDFTMTSILRVCAFGFALLLTTITTSWAAEPTIILRLGSNAGSVISIERSFETILIGDPDVVDVHPNNDRSVVLEPLNLGATNLVFVDERSVAVTNIRVLVCSATPTRVKYQDGAGCE